MHYGLLEDTPPGQWVPDVLDGFSRRTLPLGEDAEGPVSATLVRANDDADGPPVLYIHGWSDYFYNTELAEAAAESNYQFYALDLRKYGRSMRSGQSPGYIEDLTQYDEEIAAAFAVLKQDHRGHLPAVIAHSTGALVAALWAHRHPNQLGGLVLNSPWLELQGNAWLRGFANAVADPLWRAVPERKLLLPKFDNFYRTVSATEYGEWVLHPIWRPRYPFDIQGGWLAAILAGHNQIRAGLDIDVPVMVLLSTKTHISPRYSPIMQSADSVLDVDATAKRAMHLGNRVMVHRVPDAIHDVYASRKPVRDAAFNATFTWLDYMSAVSR